MKEQNGVSVETILTYDADHNEVLKMESTTYVDLEKSGKTKEDLEESDKVFKSTYADSIKGVSYQSSIKDNIYEGTLLIDMEKADIEELVDKGLVGKPGDNVKKVDYEMTLDNLKALGQECK